MNNDNIIICHCLLIKLEVSQYELLNSHLDPNLFLDLVYPEFCQFVYDVTDNVYFFYYGI